MISFPILNYMSDDKSREEFKKAFKDAKADRIFLFVHSPIARGNRIKDDLKLLAENIKYYSDEKNGGYEIGVWIQGLGHGGELTFNKENDFAKDFTKIRGLANGIDAGDSFCPLDKGYRAMYKNFVKSLALILADLKHCLKKPPLIMIDDDLRISLHGQAVIGCACDEHIRLLNKRAKEAKIINKDYSRKEFADVLFTGKSNNLRKLWLDLMKDTLSDFAYELRETVNEADDEIRLGLCACLPTWDTDGVSSVELSKILAGKTKPFVRLIGAPYWNTAHIFKTVNLGSIINIERMEKSWCKGNDIEIMTEGDVFPRPRFRVPSTFLECFHQALSADGQKDILKYLLDYYHNPSYDYGYINRHIQTENLRNSIDKSFENTEGAGVFVFENMKKIEDMDCTGLSEREIVARFTPASANFSAVTNLPVTYDKSKYTDVSLVFGENGKYVNDEILNTSMILDVVSAEILQDKGIDVGIISSNQMEKAPTTEIFSDGIKYPVNTAGKFKKLTVSSEAKVLSWFENGEPSVYTYKRANGKNTLVYAFDMESVAMNTDFLRNYNRSSQILNYCFEESSHMVKIEKESDLFIIYRKNEEKTVVGIWNFGMDSCYPDKIELSEKYSELEPIFETKAILKEKNVFLNSQIYPYSFGGFILKK